MAGMWRRQEVQYRVLSVSLHSGRERWPGQPACCHMGATGRAHSRVAFPRGVRCPGL